jgi:hypothetical protein
MYIFYCYRAQSSYKYTYYIARYILDTLTYDSDFGKKTVEYSSSYYSSFPNIYFNDGKAFNFSPSSYTLYFNICDLPTATLTSIPITTTAYPSSMPSVHYIDFDRQEIYFSYQSDKSDSSIKTYCKMNLDGSNLTTITDDSLKMFHYLGNLSDEIMLYIDINGYVNKLNLSTFSIIQTSTDIFSSCSEVTDYKCKKRLLSSKF